MKNLKIGQRVIVDIGYYCEENKGKTENVTIMYFDMLRICVKTVTGVTYFINQWQIV